MALRTFKIGGVHPPECKIAEHAAIEELGIPKRAIFPLGQSLGAPSVPIVKKGDMVKVGQLIAKGEAFISSNIHSSVSGKVFAVDDYLDASGYRKPSIIIDVEGDEWEEGIDRSPNLKRDFSLSKEEILNKIKEAGIVGMGGAAFPTHVKLTVPAGKKAECLIINAVECEPYLTADHRLMLEKGEEMLVGVSIIMRALEVSRAIIGIENNKKDAIQHLSESAKKFQGIKIMALKVKYPQGAEKQLVKAAINREIPSGKLPLEVGAVVTNAGTSLAVYEAVQKNKPLIDRIVTLTGKSVAKPSNFLVRNGSPVFMLIEAAGGLPEDTGKIISGGPMMGKAVTSTDIPVTKGTSGILLMTQKESKRVPVQNCIRCAKCTTACPMGLEPYYLAILSTNENYESLEKEGVMDCIECGSCHFTCPSGRPLLDTIRVGKNQVGKIIRNRNVR
ncbi:MAG: electron transport complex subunit RsxC [Bacteroidales bacterium]|jgi:electron transport complex protein RnfC|nr:electron transport complex subunit RsxC [Bacteroidales bacterium]